MVMMISVTTDASRAGSTALLQQNADQRCSSNGKNDRKRQRQACLEKGGGRHAADHHELALGEVDDVARVVDDREAQGDTSA